MNNHTKNTYEKLFSHLGDVPTPDGLAHAVVARVAFERKRSVQRRRVLFGGLSLTSLVAFVPTISMLMQDVASTGFLQYSTLLLSDSSIVLRYGTTFALSLAETLPIVSTSLLLALTSLFIWSVTQTFHYSPHKLLWI
jgi:hypothetical protein